MKKLAINFENVLTIKKELNKPLLEVLTILKNNGVSALDISYDKAINNEYYSQIISAGFIINTVYYLSDLSVKNNFSKEMEIVDFCSNRNIKRIFLVTKLDENLKEKNIIQNLRRIVKYASNFNVLITIENFGYENSPFSKLNNLLGYLKAVKGLGLTFDIGNFYLVNENPYNCLQALKEYVSNVHLKDRKLVKNPNEFSLDDINGNKTIVVSLGMGDCEVNKILNDLKDGAVNCDYCLEFDFKSERIYDKCIESAINFFTELN